MSCAKQFFTVQVKWQLLAYLIFSLSAAFSPFRYTSITNKGEEETETVEKSRFAELSEDDLHAIVDRAEAQATKNTTKWVVKLFEGKHKTIEN